MAIPYTLTKSTAGKNGSLNMIIDATPYHVSEDNAHFEEIKNLVISDANPAEILKILNTAKEKLEVALEVTEQISIKGGSVYFEDEPVNNFVCTRMLEMLEEGFNLKPMAKFLTNLMDNPDAQVVKDLYEFVEFGNIPLDEDGNILVFKAIREDWKDIHSGTMDNSIGQVVKMRRHRVNPDRTQTCSHGLHVCSYDYLPHFAHANGHVVICKVNPAHVVAIPADYNNTKMRVCEYEVIAEFEDYYAGKGNFLGTSTVFADDDFADDDFVDDDLADDCNWQIQVCETEDDVDEANWGVVGDDYEYPFFGDDISGVFEFEKAKEIAEGIKADVARIRLFNIETANYHRL